MGLMLAIPLLAAAGEAPTARVEESREVVKDFMQQLKAALQQAMKEGGPVNAIAVCNEKAPQIAERMSATSGWEVGRTSLKVRNPSNAPDEWERAVLESFETRKAQGEPAAKLEHYEIAEQDGQAVFRYMKAIPTGQLCVICHGENLSEPVKAKLDALYPQDRARGFQVGDIRGAFSIVQPLEDQTR
jgi:hypothetical protein